MFIRKIHAPKWLQNNIDEGAPVSADAITNCSKTTKNTLSIWEIKGEEAIQSGVLAIAASLDHLDAFDVVILPGEDIDKAGLKLEKTNGETAAKHLADTHYDIISLNYDSLGCFAKIVVKQFKAKKVNRYTKATLRKILKNAIEEGPLKIEDLRENIRKEFAPA